MLDNACGVLVYAILTVISFWKAFLLKTTTLVMETKLFLSSNGSSVIDLCLVSGRIATQVGFELTTDPNVELFTGAPQRGHIPSIVKCNLSRTTEEGSTKPWLQKADWEACQNVLEKSSHASLEAVQCPSATDHWGSVLVDITEATRLAIPYKRSSRHSKPFWSKDLSQQSAELEALRKKFKYCSNYSNGERLNNAKNEFKSVLSEKSSEWMRETLSGLSYRKGQGFRQKYRHVFQMIECAIGPLQSSDGRLVFSKEEISDELRKTFFLGQHLKGRSFDEDHYVEVTRRVRNQDPQINAENDAELFDEDFSMYELEFAIKDIPQSDAFDNDGIHASMLKHFGIRMKLRLLKLFNSCWHESTWSWNSSRVIFIKKPGKSTFAFSSSYRPVILSSHVGKLFERMINRRLRTFFTCGKKTEEEQDGFIEKRSSVRSLYRMQLELEDIQRKKTSGFTEYRP